MIKKIKINNFQSHKNTEIFFTEGINVISGTTNHGKSAIVKAMIKVFENRPQGDSFVSYFKDKKESTKIEIEFPEDTVIREKGKKFDGYIIGEEKYEALRTNVPEQVKDICKIFPVNIQRQRDQFFLLDKSPGEVGKYFNKVVGLDEMNTVLKKANDEARNLKAVIKNQEKEIWEVEEKIKSKKWIIAAKECYNKIKSTEEKIKNIQKRKEKIQEEVQKIFLIEQEKSKIDISSLPECLNMQIWLKEQKEKIEESKILFQKIQNILDSIKKIKQHLKLFQNTENQTEFIKNMVFDIGDIKELKNKQKIIFNTVKLVQKSHLKLNEYESIEEKEKALFCLFKALKTLQENKNKQKRISCLVKKIKEYQNIYNKIDVQKTQKEMETFLKETGHCPVCGSEL